MRYKQYLNESNKITDFQTILEILWNKCNPFLKDLLQNGFTGDFLYSGRNDYKKVFIKKVRDNRYPMDTNYDIHQLYDEEFLNSFGFRARSNAIFCIGNVDTANGYGNKVYMIFPMGNYRFVYSEDISDLYIFSKNRYSDDAKDDWMEDHYEEKEYDDRELLKKEYHDSYGENTNGGHWEYTNLKELDVYNLPVGIGDRNDALVYIDEELGFTKVRDDELEWVPDEDMEEWLDDNIDRDDILYELEKEWDEYLNNEIYRDVQDYENKNINNAIKSGNEIMLNCKYYVAIDYKTYYDTLSSYYKLNGYKEPNSVKIKTWYKSRGRSIPKQLELFNGRPEKTTSKKYVDTIIGTFKV